jgi:hypothetical protein
MFSLCLCVFCGQVYVDYCCSFSISYLSYCQNCHIFLECWKYLGNVWTSTPTMKSVTHWLDVSLVISVIGRVFSCRHFTVALLSVPVTVIGFLCNIIIAFMSVGCCSFVNMLNVVATRTVRQMDTLILWCMLAHQHAITQHAHTHTARMRWQISCHTKTLMCLSCWQWITFIMRLDFFFYVDAIFGSKVKCKYLQVQI